jgi:hypothetical protein
MTGLAQTPLASRPRAWATRGLILTLALLLSAPPPSSALPLGFGGGDTPEVAACAAERAPIIERKRQYDALRRSQIASALGQGLKKGAMFFAGAMLSHYGLGGGSNNSDSGSGGGGIAGLLSPDTLGQAANLPIPGVTLAANGAAFGRPPSGNDTRAIAAVAVVIAIAGTVEAYVRLKEAAANGDSIVLAQSIDDDAGLQVGVSRSIDSEEQALVACRQKQVTDLNQHLASARNDSDRRSLTRQRSRVQGAVQQDVDLTGGLVDQQATLAKTFTQGRAMAENRSEADILGGQAPAYEQTASTTPLQLPPPEANSTSVTPVSNPAPAPTGYVTARAAAVRASPSTKAKRVKIIEAGVTLQPLQDPVGAEWLAFDMGGGTPGYVRMADLTAPKGPHLAPPSNIREHNQAVIAARDDGPKRLKTLLTDIQARRRGHIDALFARLSRLPEWLGQITLG